MRPWRLCSTLLVLPVLFMLLPSPAPSRAAATTSEADTFAQDVIERTNIERVNQGLPPLKRQDSLEASAMWSAQDMATNNYFDHTDSQGRTIGQRYPAFEYTGYSRLGENIAGGAANPADVVQMWMNSPGHRANILDAQFCEIGAGYAFSATSTYQRYWVQGFGCRFNTYPMVINNEAASTTSVQVNLYLYGTGTAKEMRLSNDNAKWSAWETFAAKRAWTLTNGNGTHTVYAQLRSDSTVWTTQDTIELVSPATSTPTTTTTPVTITTPATTSLRFYLPLLLRLAE